MPVEARFHKAFEIGSYMRRSRDRGTFVPRCTYDNLTNFMYAVFKVHVSVQAHQA